MKDFPGQSRLPDHRARIQAGPWLLLHLHQDEESNWRLSVALSHERDLHLLFLEGGLRGQIQDHISIAVFPRIVLIPEGQKKWNDVLLLSNGSFRSLPVRKTTNGSFRSHHIKQSQ